MLFFCHVMLSLFTVKKLFYWKFERGNKNRLHTLLPYVFCCAYCKNKMQKTSQSIWLKYKTHRDHIAMYLFMLQVVINLKIDSGGAFPQIGCTEFSELYISLSFPCMQRCIQLLSPEDVFSFCLCRWLDTCIKSVKHNLI